MLPLALACAPAAPPPDVLVVVLDTVRADRLRPWGGTRPISPQLEALAEAGVVWTEATAPASWTLPSHASLFTGLPSWEHGARRYDAAAGGAVDVAWQVGALHDSQVTLAERFRDAGYLTMLFSTNAWLAPEFGLQQGFRVALAGTDEAVTVQNAVTALSQERGPMFVVVNLMGAHDPWEVHPALPFVGRHLEALEHRLAPGGDLAAWRDQGATGLAIAPQNRVDGLTLAMHVRAGNLRADGNLLVDLYDGELAAVDARLRTLVEAWNAAGHRGVVAVLSDHGEALGEDGWLGHGLTLRRNVLHVPLVVAAPGRLPAGARVTSPTTTTGLHDLVLELAGLPGAVGVSLPLPDRPGAGVIAAAGWPDLQWAAKVPGVVVDRAMVRQGDAVAVLDGAGDVTGWNGPVQASLEQAVRALVPGGLPRAPPTAPVVPAGMEARLKALGYIE